MTPRMVFADSQGQLLDHPRLEMVVFDGRTTRRPRRDELIPLPDGSDMFVLPGRAPLGFDPRRNAITPFAEDRRRAVVAAAAFIAPAYVRLNHPAFAAAADAPALPTFGYAPLGFADGKFWTTAFRVDPERRQDPALFDLREIRRRVRAELAVHANNRLLKHLERCALSYQCRAAQNFFLRRWEAPLPTARHCNAACLGCISLQPEGACPANHERIAFVPTADEVAEVALLHFGRVERAVASFGQGCEGEPLLNGTLLEESLRKVRAATDQGTLNLNTNASLPQTVRRLMAAGLDSLRVSIASAREPLYNAYHAPHGYTLADVRASAAAVKAAGGFLSLNLLVFPGVTDTEPEIEALLSLLRDPGVDMVQLRNLNVDPGVYLDRAAAAVGTHPPVGLRRLQDLLRQASPNIMFGYFNPPKERFGPPRAGAVGERTPS